MSLTVDGAWTSAETADGRELFVSHDHVDGPFVEREVIPLLRDRGMQFWIATRHSDGETSWIGSLDGALARAAGLVVVVSHASLKSQWVQAEVEFFLRESPRGWVLPLRVDAAEPHRLHPLLGLRQFVDFHAGTAAARASLARHIEAFHARKGKPDSKSGGTFSAETLLRDFDFLVKGPDGARDEVKRRMDTIAWARVEAVALGIARGEDPTAKETVLRGLGVLGSTPRKVATLRTIVDLLHGELRSEGLLLLDRKELRLEYEAFAQELSASFERLRLEDILGRGLFTSSFLGVLEDADLRVVVRVLRREFAHDHRARLAFKQQSRLFAHSSEGLLGTRLPRFDDERCLYWSIRDHVEGTSLDGLLRDSGPLAESQALGVIAQLADSLSASHDRNLCHGGIKPSNVFLGQDGRVTLGDPGLPIHLAAGHLDRLVYDYAYAAPECHSPEHVATPLADVFSLGAVLWFLLTGEAPFQGRTAEEVRLAKQQPSLPDSPTCSAATRKLVFDSLLDAPSRKPEISARFAASARQILSWLSGIEEPRPVAHLSVLEHAYSLVHTLERPDSDTSQAESTRGDESGWQKVKAAYFRLADLDDAKREDALAQLRAEDSCTAQEVEALFSEAEQDDFLSPPESQPTKFEKLGDFKLLHVIGRGGMATVYRARQEGLERDVAVKVLQVSLATSAETLERFHRETRAVAKLVHPNIVSIYSEGVSEMVHWFAMELINGHDLQREIGLQRSHGKHSVGRILPEHGTQSYTAAVVQACSDVAAALQVAHELGVVHRDIKPSNILLSHEGTPKIVDFGLARDEHLGSLTRSGEVAGTPFYMSPEQTSAKRDTLDQRVDIYSLGVVLYELLSLQRPFEGDTMTDVMSRIRYREAPLLSRVSPSVPRSLANICHLALEREPSRRYQTAAEFRDDLLRFLRGEPVMARGLSVLERTRRACLRHRYALTLLAIACLASALTLLVVGR